MSDLVGPRLYSCCNCRNHVALHDDVISKAFQVWEPWICGFSLLANSLQCWIACCNLNLCGWEVLFWPKNYESYSNMCYIAFSVCFSTEQKRNEKISILWVCFSYLGYVCLLKMQFLVINSIIQRTEPTSYTSCSVCELLGTMSCESICLIISMRVDFSLAMTDDDSVKRYLIQQSAGKKWPSFSVLSCNEHRGGA